MNLKWIGKVAGAGAVMFGTVSAGVLDEPYGICSHVSRRDWDFPFARQEFALMNRTGIRWVRSDYDWARVEPQPGKWDFSHLDQLQAEADRAGIHILPILAYDVKWATPAWKHPDAWGEYVRRLVTRYGKKLRCWEVWNEQNSVGFWKDAVNGENYVKLLRRTWQEIKKIDPELQVVYGGTAGVPFEFIGETLRAGAANWFDAMNIHPYHRNGTPENLIPQLKELRALMTQYGAGNKPIWISEVGWSTAETPTIHQAAIPAALQRAGIDAGRTAAAVIDDPENGFSNTAKFSVGRDFPMFREIVKVKLAELKGLDIRRTPVLLVLGESFPAAQIDDLIDFVRRGGTLLCANGLPFYLELNSDGRGNMVTTPVGSRYMKKFHLGWETWWVDETVPRSIKGVGPAAGFRFEGEPRLVVQRFLNGDNLLPGDEFIPVVQAANANYRGTVVGLYRMNSDLKGNIIVCTPSTEFRISEELQAELLPRTYLIALAHGVQRIFWYNLRAQEREPMEREDHYGIVRRDLSPKPARQAYRTLTGLCPSGSTRPELSVKGKVYFASWRKPDGVRVWALWSVEPQEPLPLKITGRIAEVRNHLGEKCLFSSGRINVGSAVFYLVGPENITLP